MSKIIVAIDFSDCSINAFIHALSVAQKCKSDLLLVWVMKPVSDKDKFEEGKDPTKEVVQQFEELISKHKHELPGNKIEYKIRTGKIYKEIADEAKESNAMLVVTGTHGATVFVEFWIGSNANRIVSLSPCPVITIRAGIDISRSLTKIVMPIDSSMETRQKATFTAYIAKQHGAEVKILSLYTSKVKAMRQNVDLYSQQVATYMQEMGINYTVESVVADNVSDATIEYAKKVDANLIVIMTSQESNTSNLWMGPYAQQMVNRSPMPVLSIHPMNTLAAGLSF